MMTQDERRIYLINYLLREDGRIRADRIPAEEKGQQELLRALMNMRMPEPISEEFLRVQDEYLTERSRERGITDAAGLTPVRPQGKLCLWQGDITTLKCDAIVNACNSQMLGCFQPLHGCIDNFIHTYAGIELRLKMHEIMQAQGHEEPTGEAKITPGYNLPAKYILHTVGPIVSQGWGYAARRQSAAAEGAASLRQQSTTGRAGVGGSGSLAGAEFPTAEQRRLLASCYTSCLRLAAEHGVESIAFCCISTGVFGFPKQAAAEIAVATVTDYLSAHKHDPVQKVIFNVFGDEDLRIYQRLLNV